MFVDTARKKTKLRRSDIIPYMPPLRGFGICAWRFYKYATPTEFTETRHSHSKDLLSNSMAVVGWGEGQNRRRLQPVHEELIRRRIREKFPEAGV